MIKRKVKLYDYTIITDAESIGLRQQDGLLGEN
mgnify:CR=1 FL=1